MLCVRRACIVVVLVVVLYVLQATCVRASPPPPSNSSDGATTTHKKAYVPLTNSTIAKVREHKQTLDEVWSYYQGVWNKECAYLFAKRSKAPAGTHLLVYVDFVLDRKATTALRQKFGAVLILAFDTFCYLVSDKSYPAHGQLLDQATDDAINDLKWTREQALSYASGTKKGPNGH